MTYNELLNHLKSLSSKQQQIDYLFSYLLNTVKYDYPTLEICKFDNNLLDFIDKHHISPNIELWEQIFLPFYSRRYLEFLYYLACDAHSKDVDLEVYFTTCFNVIFELLEDFTRMPFEKLEKPNIAKNSRIKREIRFVKDLLYLENSHIVRLNQENRELREALKKFENKI